MVSPMQLAIGFFWGAFFGTVALMLAGAIAAFVQSHQRVALAAGLTALLSALFVASYLGGLPLADPDLEARLVSHIGLASAIMLKLLLLVDLGLLREPRNRRRILAGLATVAALTVLACWLVPPPQAPVLAAAVSFALAVLVLLVTVRSALGGDRLAWLAVSALAFLLVPVAGLGWIAHDPQAVPWEVHAASALGGMTYLAIIGAMLWQRYSYLIELREVLSQGPRYDPITRMHSNTGTDIMVRQAFVRQHGNQERPVVLVAVSIGNLYALENLHGRQALNHALFVCATRLRRCAPGDVDMGRLAEDGFLLVSRNARDFDRLVNLGRLIAQRLSRPLMLRTGAVGNGEEGHADWAAQVGVGLRATTGQADPGTVVAKVRDMSRTAWSFASRVAWHDQASGAIAELPLVEPAR
jgi:GGDEF domain-containing protein